MKRPHALGWTLLIAMFLTASFTIVGCSSDDPVTPHDDTDLTNEDVAYQAGFLAYSIVNVLPVLSSKAVEELETLAGFNGDFWLDSTAKRVWTDSEHMLSWEPAGYDISLACEFDITATLGLANGEGTLSAGTLVIDFDIENVTVMPSGYPTAGQVIVSSGGLSALIMFSGGTATVQVGLDSWTIDLSDGTIS